MIRKKNKPLPLLIPFSNNFTFISVSFSLQICTISNISIIWIKLVSKNIIRSSILSLDHKNNRYRWLPPMRVTIVCNLFCGFKHNFCISHVWCKVFYKINRFPSIEIALSEYRFDVLIAWAWHTELIMIRFNLSIRFSIPSSRLSFNLEHCM